MDIRKRLCRYLGTKTKEDLFEAGILDSFEILKLITFLEKEFNVSLKDAEARDFRTIDMIVELVAKNKVDHS